MSQRSGLVLVHSSDELYGADRMLLEIIEAARKDHSVEVWLPTDAPHPEAPLCAELERRGVRTVHMSLPIIRRAYLNPRGAVATSARVRSLWRGLRVTAPGTVYCTTSAALLAAPIARLARVPVVAAHFQEIWSTRDRYLLGTLARACHTLLAISDAVVSSLPNTLRSRTTVIPNATPAPSHVAALRNRTGPLRFLIASRWNGWKGHRTLLAAWALAGAPGRLVVLGGPPPSGTVVDVVALVNGLDKPETVEIVGEVADPSAHIDQADVVLMPSDQPEPFGLVAIEAFARGRPVIASAAGGLLDIVTHGHDGWHFPLGDAQALAALLGRLTRQDVEAAGDAARLTYQDRYISERFNRNWRTAMSLHTG